MWLSISITSIITLCILLEIIETNSMEGDDKMDMLFRQRSDSDWERVWHHESHSRCREKLIRHLYWACEKDIYRLTRRSQLMDDVKKRSRQIPWLEKRKAKKILYTRRFQRSTISGTPSSITAECCTRIGCTWEEYAEYCPSNKRKDHGVKYYD